MRVLNKSLEHAKCSLSCNSHLPLDRRASTYAGIIASMFTENVTQMYLENILL